MLSRRGSDCLITINDEEIGPPYNRVKAIGDIKKALICPLTWSEVFRIDADESF